MKSVKALFIILPLVVLFFSSCDKIKTPYATVKPANVTDTVIDWDTVVPVQRVLLEDYTGHKCVNCPEASVIAHSLEDANHGKVIVLAVHAGYQALPGTGEYAADYRSDAGEIWNVDFGINSINPQGMINRKVFGGTLILSKDVWSNDVAAALTETPQLLMLATNEYDSTTRNVKLTVYSHFTDSLPGSFNITICVAEDSLISGQKNNNPAVGTTPDIHNYVFKDVLRGSVNGTYGEVLTTSADPKLTYKGKFSFPLVAAWVPKNCWILAFVSKTDTKEIIQVIKQRVNVL